MEGNRQQLPEPYIVRINFFQFKMKQTTVKLCNQLNIESGLWSSSIFCEEKLIFLKEEKNQTYACTTVSENASIIEVQMFRAVTKYVLEVFSILKRLAVKIPR